MKIANYEIEVNQDGTLNYNGSLYLAGAGITSLPDNLTVGGYLDLRGTGITSLPDNLTVGGYLDLAGAGITSLPDNLTVCGYLYMRGTGITSLPDNLTVGGSLDLRGTGITSLPDNLTVGGYLDLEGTGITSLPDNLTVGGSLDLRGTGITSLPDNLTVGGYLDLAGTGITSLPDNLTVCGYLYMRGTGITDTQKINKDVPKILSWRSGKYVLIDGIFAEVVRKRNGVFKLKKPNSNKVFFCVTDGNGRYAHGDTVKDAKDDLLYKLSSDDQKEQYKDISLESILTFDECIRFYRVMTGACAFGVKNFIESNNIERRSYTVREILTITKGQYGSDSLAFLRKASK